MKEKIPTYNICNLLGENNCLQDAAVYDLQTFLSTHQNLVFPHRHSFYQILYITEGSGKHIIDFETYPVKTGMVYLLAPSQVHKWIFEEDVNGYLFNFTDNYLASFLSDKQIITDLPFFSGNHKYSAYQLNQHHQTRVVEIFANIMQTLSNGSFNRNKMIKTLLLELVFFLEQILELNLIINHAKNNHTILTNFEKLIEKHYLSYRLPKQYAELLFISPNHLNVLCKELVGKSAGELIRDRVLLEAKRLLINSNENISEIAYKLNFEDNSYFTKFFKKYVYCTPEEFRKLQL